MSSEVLSGISPKLGQAEGKALTPSTAMTPEKGTSEKISVILPFYNREDTLAESARSVLDQTHQNLVLYLINDGSTDNSRRVARNLDDSRIVHIDLDPNRGVSRARNAGLSQASTSLLAFMDSDDVWLPDKLEVQVGYLRGAQAADPDISVSGCGWRFYGSDIRTKNFVSGPYTRIDVLHNRVAGMGTPTLLIDRSVAVEDARFDESLPSLEEGDYVMSCLANDTRIVVVPEVLLLVRRDLADHLARPQLTATAWEAFILKYSKEMADFPKLRSWYSYRAARDHLINRDIRDALRHAPVALADQRAKRSVHLGLGLLGGRTGLAIAQKLVQLSKSAPTNKE